jgi:hypothetical protein
MMSENEIKVYNLKGLLKPKAQNLFESKSYYKNYIQYSENPVSIIIDNGSYECKAVN